MHSLLVWRHMKLISRGLAQLKRDVALLEPQRDDRYDYDGHMRRRGAAYAVATGILIVGVALRAVLMLIPSMPAADANAIAEFLDRAVAIMTRELAEGAFSTSHIVASVALILAIALAVWISTEQAHDHAAFIEAYGEMDKQYSPMQMRAGMKAARICRLSGWWLLTLDVVVETAIEFAVTDGFRTLNYRVHHTLTGAVATADDIRQAVFYGVLALAAMLIVLGGLSAKRYDVFDYNLAVLRTRSSYDIEKNESGDRRLRLLAERHELVQEHRIDGANWAVAVTVALTLYSLPSLDAHLCWIPLVLGAFVTHRVRLHYLRRATAIAAQQGSAGRPWNRVAL